MHRLIKIVYDTIEKHRLLQSEDTVIVALSGGADSVCLLHCMLALKDSLHLREIRALHVHHGLRGETADRDDRFVRQLCDSLSVPLTVVYVDVLFEAQKHGETVEEAGRRLRYNALEQEADKHPSAKILTAHSADDQAETVLMRLIRGCGTKGLGGIPVQRERIVRPLLACTSEDIRSFCEECAYEFVTDETNFDSRYTRNFVRHQLMAPMKTVNPSASLHMAATAELVAEEDRYLHRLALDLWKRASDENGFLDVDVLSEYDTVLVRRALRIACEQFGGTPQRHHIITLTEHINENFSMIVSGGLTVRCAQRKIQFERIENKTFDDKVLLKVPGIFHFGPKSYLVTVISKKEYDTRRNVHKNLFNFCISYDMIEGVLCLRSRKQGDRIRIFGRHCSKSIKKWMIEQQVPCLIRDSLPVLCDDNGVLAVLGHIVDERCAVSDKTNDVLCFEPID